MLSPMLPVYEKELFAVMFTLEKLSSYLLVQNLLFLLTMQLWGIFWRKRNPNQDWLNGSFFYNWSFEPTAN